MTYLETMLAHAKQVHRSIIFNPFLSSKYPKFVTMVSDKWPTPTRFRASFRPCTYKPSESSFRASISRLERSLLKSSSFEYVDSHFIPESHQKDIFLSYPSRFDPGDGLVPRGSMDMPAGYSYDIIETPSNHIFMLNDIENIEKALLSAQAD